MSLALFSLIQEISPICQKSQRYAKRHWNTLAKPIGALGVLETDIAKIAGIQRSKSPSIDKKALVIFCADNGITKEGVSQTDSKTTFLVANNMAKGLSATQIMAKKAGIDSFVIDVGMQETSCSSDIVNMKVRCGTNDFLETDAMTQTECITIMLKAADLVQTLVQNGYNLIMAGEMGIGNTTTSAAVASVLLEKPSKLVAGKGAGCSHDTFIHKIEVIEKGIEKRKPNKKSTLDVLSKLGGFDIAAMTGFYLGAAKAKVAVVLDGLISYVAALCAARLCPIATQYFVASHEGKEKACRLLQKALKKKDKTIEPVMRAAFKLGEGSGAVFLCSLLDMAQAVYNGMIDFSSLGLEKYKVYK